MKILIKLIEVGRNKISKDKELNIKTDDVQVALESSEMEALKLCEENLMSSIVNLYPNEKEYSDFNSYDVCVGEIPRHVGKVTIEVLE